MRRLFVLVFGVCFWLPAVTERWPQFRGEGSTGVAEDDPRLPDQWSSTQNVVWKIQIPGRGWSSPIVWGDRIFVTTVVSAEPEEKARKGLYFGGERSAPNHEHRWMVYAIDFDSGRVVWEREVHRATPSFSRHLKNSYASETPVTDGQLVYAYFGCVGVFAFDFSGKLVWSRKFEPVRTRYGWGTAASPVLDGNRLYIVNDNEDRSVLLALDKKTGKTIWEVPRDEKSNWVTPYVWQSGKRTEIVTAGSNRVRSYDLDGKLLWELRGMSSIAIPTPFSKFGLLYVSSGYVGDSNRPVFAIRSGARGDISLEKGQTSNDFIAWFHGQLGPYNPSPIVYGDIYYTLYDRGFFAANDAQTGKEIYPRVRISEEVGAYTASPWAYNGKVFVLSEDGDTFVIQAGPQFKILGKNSLDEFCMASPAIARGSLLIRTESKLYRITKR
ncbi:MAG: PQQ-binding-like beta-propeller repeat protein [Bryobacteraceae bacterium]|nr:PQQ-binding-like beta-propeller repeat protein [Bryobacteraceae bacterium]MDW8378712.1 PQQ-binding-like beta-propeller repeat protein [Bryobacterales bacterium]